MINIMNNQNNHTTTNKHIATQPSHEDHFIVSAGATYLDIDAYACMVAMRELLALQGQKVIAYSDAPCNYSVCQSLVAEGQLANSLPPEFRAQNAKYIIVDVSDPEYIKAAVPLDQVTAVYDHHVGFEAYWDSRIGENSHIEFIGAAATLIYREWKKAGLLDKMRHSTAGLLIAAILDNTLNLTSSNTTPEDVEVFQALCAQANIGADWCAGYFSEVQASVEADLRNALFNDTKTVRGNPVLPPRVAQICVWDADKILENLPRIRQWFDAPGEPWMINVIDIQHRCSYFVCDDPRHQKKIGRLFEVEFQDGVAKTPVSYLRKEIIKKTLCDQ